MAINGSDKSFSKMEFPLGMKRQDAFPLDDSSIFYSMSDAQTYAQSNPTAYVGQVIAVVEGGVSTIYQIKNASRRPGSPGHRGSGGRRGGPRGRKGRIG